MMENHIQKKNYQIKPIGSVRETEHGTCLLIDPPYRPALRQVDRFSHVIVFWWADKHDNEKHRSIMVTDLPYAPGISAGVFACRAEYRPNPIAITICEVLEVDEDQGTVTIPGIDAQNGTPLVDIKPYIPVCDRLRDVRVPEWFGDWPDWVEDAESYFAQSELDVS